MRYKKQWRLIGLSIRLLVLSILHLCSRSGSCSDFSFCCQCRSCRSRRCSSNKRLRPVDRCGKGLTYPLLSLTPNPPPSTFTLLLLFLALSLSYILGITHFWTENMVPLPLTIPLFSDLIHALVPFESPQPCPTLPFMQHMFRMQHLARLSSPHND
jgi:hypothetical protein